MRLANLPQSTKDPPGPALPLRFTRLGTISPMWSLTDAYGTHLGWFTGARDEPENAATVAVLEEALEGLHDFQQLLQGLLPTDVLAADPRP